MPKIKIDSETLSANDLVKIKSHVDSVLRARKCRAVASPEVFDAIADKLDSDLNRANFALALCAAVNAKRLPGFEVKRGKAGGIGYGQAESKTPEPKVEPKIVPPPKAVEPPSDESEAFEELEPAKEEEVEEPKSIPTIRTDAAPVHEPSPSLSIPPPPLPKSSPTLIKEHKLVVGNEVYLVPMSSIRMKTLLVNVLGGQEDTEGDIEFEGVRYSCPEVELLENVLFFLCDAKHIVGEGAKSA